MTTGATRPSTDRPRTGPRQVAVVLGLTALVFGVLDALWLGVVSRDLYEQQIGHLLAERANVGAAAAFYVVYVLGLTHFVVRPSLDRALGRSLVDAAAFGLVTYATFDLTTMAVMRDVPLVVVLVDLAWGAAVCTATTAAVVTVLRRRSR
ncbi:DUF2177 family protein [Phycicoccus sp. BSK3Z-2]|uniref:DUF2177 family protein n=1 Tax=Phycicoccus avicenniae TaxID=2828860 RepID=A0A941D625_9MICO|nr:DUF2177 family protein [Phycicoccus avicenniae]MBR7741798.1 DUF2177 family protein [Phycicoccus avicenniae]